MMELCLVKFLVVFVGCSSFAGFHPGLALGVGILPEDDRNNRIPSNIRMITREESIQIFWDPPSDTNGVSLCVIEYKVRPIYLADERQPSIRIPVGINQNQYTIQGLDRNTDYMIKLFCFYGNTIGPFSGWIQAATRTACPGSPPHAFLGPDCIAHSWGQNCEYSCAEGYRKTGIPGWRDPDAVFPDFYVECVNGTWVSPYIWYQIDPDEICLPETDADFHRCPLSIPNGRLEPYCGPATDWLCDFKCADGYQIHPFLGTDRLYVSSWSYPPKRLYCENGAWMTGYENLGVAVDSVCARRGPNCPESVPNGRLTPKTWSSGAMLECNPGYRLKTLVAEQAKRLECINGVWYFGTTIYDPTITPVNACEPESAVRDCPSQILNGIITDDCKVNCIPNCSEGYKNLGDYHWGPGPTTVTCENGKWEMAFDNGKPYGADKACFPNDGIFCPEEIANGTVFKFLDSGTTGRIRIGFQCAPGYRRNRGIKNIECMAGRLVTGQERFGIDTSKLCLPKL